MLAEKKDLWCVAKMSWKPNFFCLTRSLLLPAGDRHGLPLQRPEMTGDPLWMQWGTGHTAASDSRGHRERQQTRQLRKDLTLLFSIINEQQSKQIRTERGWGLPECCWGAEECTRPRHRMVHTHRPSTLWLCRAYLSILQREMWFLSEQGHADILC